MNAFRRASFVGIILFLFGVGIAVYGFSFLMEYNDLERNGIKVTGKVVDINEKFAYRSPIVAFQTREGASYTFISRLEVNVNLFKYYIGQEVPVIYHGDDPTNAEIDSFWERNMPQLYLGCLGVFLMIFGLFFRRRMLRKARRFDEERKRYNY